MKLKPLLLALGLLTVSVATVFAQSTPPATAAPAWSEYTRMYNAGNGDHYYSGKQAQVKEAQAANYVWEGMTGYTRNTTATGAQPLYGLYSLARQEHLLTVSQSEYNALKANGWTGEGVSGYVATTSSTTTKPFYRFTLTTGKHFYTSNETEKTQLIAGGNSYEGTAGYMYKLAPMMVETYQHQYADGRPAPKYRQPYTDDGRVLTHGSGSDVYGARDAYLYSEGGTHYLTYDGANGTNWTVNLATSTDLKNWSKQGVKLNTKNSGGLDNSCGCYGTIHKVADNNYVMYYLGTPNQDNQTVPNLPYNTMVATATSPAGPWTRTGTVAIPNTPGTYYEDTASPGPIVQSGGKYLMFFSTMSQGKRGLAIARADSISGPWTPDSSPIIPDSEQVENIALYQQGTRWFLLTNHIGLNGTGEYTDAIWMYWSDDINVWNKDNKAVVVDGQTSWSKTVIGLPTIVTKDNRLAILYDGNTSNSQGHLGRDIGLAYINLPIQD